MQLQRSGSFVAVDDYLVGEQDGQVRHEYVDGEIYAMVGASEQWEPVLYRKGEVPLRSIDLSVTMDQLYRRTDR